MKKTILIFFISLIGVFSTVGILRSTSYGLIHTMKPVYSPGDKGYTQKVQKKISFNLQKKQTDNKIYHHKHKKYLILNEASYNRNLKPKNIVSHFRPLQQKKYFRPYIIIRSKGIIHDTTITAYRLRLQNQQLVGLERPNRKIQVATR